MNFKVEDNKFVLIVQKEIYDLDVLHKCFYSYLDKYSIEIRINDANSTECLVTMNPKNNSTLDIIEELKEKILDDLIDYKTRDIISKETIQIRELITAKAFSAIETE